MRAGVPKPFLAKGECVPRHFHAEAYATVVLAGGYFESGECGRWHVQAGDLLIHAPFSWHADQSRRGAQLLNLPLPWSVRLSACGRVNNPDLIAQLAERNPGGAATSILQSWQPRTDCVMDEPDQLAQALSELTTPNIATWSRNHAVSRATAFRCFRAAYGVGPNRYRIEARARRAWRMIVENRTPLADIAAALGYADQPHMQRDVKALTGRTPGSWLNWAAMQHSFNKLGRLPCHDE